MNRVCLTGRITKDPEIRYTQQNGTAQMNFSIAVDRQMKDAQGNRQADFISCTAWKAQAEFISKYVKKGNMLSVDGKIQTRNYQGQDGQTHYVTEIVIESVENLTPRDSNQTPTNNYGANQAPNTYQGYGQNSYQYQNTQGYNKPVNQPMPKTLGVDASDDDLPF